MKHIILSLFILLLSGLPTMAQEDFPHGKREILHDHNIDWSKTEQNVFIELYAKDPSLSPENELNLIIEQVIRPGWHTYWENPGDSGEPMKVNWTLPEGATASEISWPAPIKLPFDPLLNYGYEGEILTLQTLNFPGDFNQRSFDLPVRFDILVCKEICIPESIETKLSINNGLVQLPPAQIGGETWGIAKSFMPMSQETHKWSSTLREEGDNRILEVETYFREEILKRNNIEFFPYEYGLLDNPAKPSVTISGSAIILSQAKGDFSLDKIENVGGVIVLEYIETGDRFGYDLAPTIDPKSIPAAGDLDNISGIPSTDIANVGLLQALLFALIGGMILNLMPCVFPVLSMKALSLSKISEKNIIEARLHGLAYTAGIVLSFLAIAGLLIALKAGGSGIGWGFHLQNPVVILLLAYLFFFIGLNLAGYFEVSGRFMNIGSGKQKEGLSGSFSTGILATIVATPCTAPFMAAALGYALVQPAYISLLIFAFLGLGLALPYLMIAFIPPLQKMMPRPGTWMITFKEFLAFPMFATVIWLLWVLSQQIGLNGFFIPLIGLLLMTFSIWFLNQSHKQTGAKKGFLTFLFLAFLSLGLFSTIFSVQSIEMSKEQPMPEYGQAFSESTLEQVLSGNDPVFVEMTAAWCVTCKVNHATSIDIDQTKEIIARKNVQYLIGDWTNYDETITEYLNKYGRNGVPIYVYYGRPDAVTGMRPAPELLPQILSPSIVAEYLDQ